MSTIDVARYWNDRYSSGGNSGAGSRGQAAGYKADMVNTFVKDYGITSLLDMGCGDGYVLNMLDVEEYHGVDVSEYALELCRLNYPSLSFYEYTDTLPTADMVLSMDVILHLVNDDEFEEYMNKLFSLARDLVVLYTTNMPDNGRSAAHVYHREVTKWIRESIDGWELKAYYESPIPDGVSAGDFYVYTRES